MFPKINDVSTDLEDPPLFFVAPPADPEFNVAALKKPIEKAYGYLENLELNVSPAEGFGLVRLLIAERGWKVAGEDNEKRCIQASTKNRILRTLDDIVIEVRPRSGGSYVVMRSKSRRGKSDFGTNARRIKKFLRDL